MEAEIELWGGVECTVNRVGDSYYDQLRKNGHLQRPADVDAFAALGLSALRTPILWELCGSEQNVPPSFASVAPVLERMRALCVRPIAGLVHHGSGPRFTSLEDPGFELGLERYAEQVARAFPWIDAYTPVNEPLTTARFSGLYGHWYPHARSTRAFLRMLVHECRGTIRAMRAIRRVRPNAQLVQTEDIGTVFSTKALTYQADYENERRWLSLDLLCGRVDRDHPLYEHLLHEGIAQAELAWFVENRCPPDIVGVNYYFTSDRYLDDAVGKHPPHRVGGNGRHAYADVESVRVPGLGMLGHLSVLEATWKRFGVPIAITEVHAGCTREEQLRWLDEAYAAAVSARARGIDVRALTAWALLGSFDWTSLVTREQGVYEPGVFDVRGPVPRPTALATMLRELKARGTYDHPVLVGTGWWRRGAAPHTPHATRIAGATARPLLITGARGTLGQAFARMCEIRGLAYRLLNRDELDIADPQSVESALTSLRPWAVVNAAGFVRVDDAERDPERCHRENALGPAQLARGCRERGVQLLTFSTDLVFDGTQRAPYLEGDPVAPLCVYGLSKAEAERRVLEELESALVVRTSAFFGPWDASNFVTIALRCLARGEVFHAADDAVISPTYVPHLVHAALDLLVDGASGLWHLANVGAVSWNELALKAADGVGLPAELVRPCSFDTFELAAQRPAYSVLGSERGALLPTFEEALTRYLHESEAVAELRRKAA